MAGAIETVSILEDRIKHCGCWNQQGLCPRNGFAEGTVAAIVQSNSHGKIVLIPYLLHHFHLIYLNKVCLRAEQTHDLRGLTTVGLHLKHIPVFF